MFDFVMDNDRYLEILKKHFGSDIASKLELDQAIGIDGYVFFVDDVKWIIADVDSVFNELYYEVKQNIKEDGSISFDVVSLDVIEKYIKDIARSNESYIVNFINDISGEIFDGLSLIEKIEYITDDSVKKLFSDKIFNLNLVYDKSELKKKYDELDKEITDVALGEFNLYLLDLFVSDFNKFYRKYIKHNKKIFNKFKSLFDIDEFFEWLVYNDILNFELLITFGEVYLYDDIILYSIPPRSKSPLADLVDNFSRYVNKEKIKL